MRYRANEERPLHPVTRRPADYYWRTFDRQGNEVREPRWTPDPARKIAPLESRWFSTREVADLTGRSTMTVVSWLKKGLPAGRPAGKRSRYLIQGADLLAFLGKRPELAANVSLAEVR